MYGAQVSYYCIGANIGNFLAAKTQLSSLKKDLESVKTKYNEVSEKLMEKTRQYQKLQVASNRDG